jgi:hypothetical protein
MQTYEPTMQVVGLDGSVQPALSSNFVLIWMLFYSILLVDDKIVCHLE